MNEISCLALAAAAVMALPSPAQASEVFGGVYLHSVNSPFSLEEELESGIDLQLGFRADPIISGTKLAPYVFGALNTRGDTSYAAAGLSWKFGDAFYVRPGLGLAVHNGAGGEFSRDDRLVLGSRILFAPEVGVGARLSKRMTVEASLVHLSHGLLSGRQNPGIDNIGVRFNLGL